MSRVRASGRVNTGLFSTALVMVLVMMVAGLVVVDRALRDAAREQALLDAAASAHIVEQMLTRQIAELAVLHPAPGREALFTAHASALASDSPRATRVWVTDATGTIVRDTVLDDRPPVRTARDDSLQRAVVDEAFDTRRPAIRLAGTTAAPVVLLARPFETDRRRVGAAGLDIRIDDILAATAHDAPSTRARLALETDRGPIVVLGERHPWAPETESAAVHLPGATWRITVSHVPAHRALRIALWTLGFAAVIFLGVGVIRERRQALRVAERSAELERLSSELLRANRMKSEFLANVSHELRTPLNAIVGFVDLLRDGVYGDLASRQVPPVDRIAASATHLRHLVDQVLDIAKMAAGRLEVHAETIVMRPFVLNVASELESLISERSLNISIAVSSSLPKVRTDPTHLRQILVNLIGNAVKFTPTGGVAVRARLVAPIVDATGRMRTPEDPALLEQAPDRRKTWIALQVIDTGIGIAPSDQERIFDEFEQVNAGPRGDSMERGTGLGLAISRRLGRLLGGDVTVESQPGKGSTFTMWLPVSPVDVAPELPPPMETVEV